MAFDTQMADQMRDDLGLLPGLSEKKMFGGLCFLLHGNMVCGVHKGGAMYRVGKTRQAEAMALPGAEPMAFTGRTMGGFIDVDAGAFENDDARHRWTALALANAQSLPPK